MCILLGWNWLRNIWTEAQKGYWSLSDFLMVSTTIEAKVAETKKALEDGATEIDMVIKSCTILGRRL